MRHPLALVAGVAVVVGLLAACGGSEDSGLPDAGDGSSSVTESTATPSAEPTPTLATAYPDEGVTFANLPDVDPSHADALAVFVAFERGNIQLYKDARMNDLVADNATADVRDQFEASAADLRENDTVFRGETTIDITGFDDSRPELLQVSACFDDTKTQQIKNGGEGRPLRGDPRTLFAVTVVKIAGDWKVGAHRFLKDQKC